MSRATKNRRGVTAMLAMLYLTLFSTLALGFYACVTMAVQIASNDQRMTRTRVAAESGMQFMNYELGTLNIPAGTPGNQLFQEVYNRLSAKLNGYPNMAGQTVGISAAGDEIYVPAGNDAWINADSGGSRFRATIYKLQGGAKLRTIVVGRYNSLTGTLAVQLDYAVAQNASSIFDFGVASKSPISMNSNARIVGATNPALGSLLSTSPKVPTLNMDSNAEISGDVSFANPTAQLVMGSSSLVAGYAEGDAAIDDHLHYGAPEPEFPSIDTDAFKPFAGNPLNGGLIIATPGMTFASGTLKNILIKANTNPTFDSNVKIQGVIYIETPNQVSFKSNTEITGAVVVENDPTGDTTTNTLHFDSNARILPIDTLPDTSDFPLALRQLTGSAILAPKFAVTFNSNFGSTGGCIVGGKMQFDSNAAGVVRGSVINLEDTMVQMNGNAAITVESQGTSNYPAGVFFGSHFAPLPDTYLEVKP